MAIYHYYRVPNYPRFSGPTKFPVQQTGVLYIPAMIRALNDFKRGEARRVPGPRRARAVLIRPFRAPGGATKIFVARKHHLAAIQVFSSINNVLIHTYWQ